MNNLAMPIIVGALIIAIGVFFGAQRIAYEVSVEGQWESCVKTWNSEALKKALNMTGEGGEAVCLKRMIGTLN
jgi:hypothetical protein